MFRITEDPSSGNLVQYLAKITKMILVILANYCTRLPDNGSSVVRNMMEYF